MMSAAIFGQTLQKGNLIGTHEMNITLVPGITTDQFVEFYTNKLIPEFEKSLPGWKYYLVKSIRGEIQDSYGLIIVIKSEKDRDKYYNSDGSPTELQNSANKKLEPILKEFEKYGTVTTTYTDWLIL